jgi:hypothetical protein
VAWLRIIRSGFPLNSPGSSKAITRLSGKSITEDRLCHTIQSPAATNPENAPLGANIAQGIDIFWD